MKKLLLLVGGIIFSIFILEISVRILYKDLPEKYISIFDTFYKYSDNERLIYTHIPDWSGYATGVNVNINSLGLRNPEISEAQTKRILLIGDSMMFGFGLKEQFLISVQLQNILKNLDTDYEVINAGVCGYNLVQNFEKLKLLYEEIKPDYVIFTFIHNDIEGIHFSNGRTRPIFTSAYFPRINRDSIYFKLYNFFINEDIYKHLIYRKGIRYFLINNSRLYLFTALKLKQLLVSETGGEKPNPFICYYPNSRTVRKIVLDPLKHHLSEIKEWFYRKNLDYSFVVLNSHQMSSGFESLFLNLLEESEINFTILEPFLEDFSKITLGWDPHPNRHGARMYAELFYDILNKNKFIDTVHYFHFNNSVYSHSYDLHKKNLITDIYRKERCEFSTFNLKSRITFSKYRDYSFYPLWGVYNDNIQNLNFDSGKVVSNHFSILLNNENNYSKLFIKGNKLITDRFSARILINNEKYIVPVVSDDFIIELSVSDFEEEYLDVFMELNNYKLHNGNPVTFIIDKIWIED